MYGVSNKNEFIPRVDFLIFNFWNFDNLKFGRIILVIIEFWKKEKNLPQNLHCSVNHQVKEKKQKKRSNSKFKKKIASNFSIIKNFEKKKGVFFFCEILKRNSCRLFQRNRLEDFEKKKKRTCFGLPNCEKYKLKLFN